MISEFPSKEEQELVRKYVLERPLYRPNITYLKAIFIVLSIVAFSICLSLLLFKLSTLLGFAFKKTIFFAIFFGIEAIILLRPLEILCVRLYQRYAEEEVRRRCLLKPTCSEYAIIVIKKYGALIGTIKTWCRLTKKCCGDVYYIDEP